MNKQTSVINRRDASTAKNGARVLIWSLAWVLTTALAAFGPKVIWDFHTGLTIRPNDTCRAWMKCTRKYFAMRQYCH